MIPYSEIFHQTYTIPYNYSRKPQSKNFPWARSPQWSETGFFSEDTSLQRAELAKNPVSFGVNKLGHFGRYKCETYFSPSYLSLLEISGKLQE
jgi:hypothetical protein